MITYRKILNLSLFFQVSDLNGAGDAGKDAVVEGKKPTEEKAEPKTEEKIEMDPETLAKKIKRQIEVLGQDVQS